MEGFIGNFLLYTSLSSYYRSALAPYLLQVAVRIIRLNPSPYLSIVLFFLHLHITIFVLILSNFRSILRKYPTVIFLQLSDILLDKYYVFVM